MLDLGDQTSSDHSYSEPPISMALVTRESLVFQNQGYPAVIPPSITIAAPVT